MDITIKNFKFLLSLRCNEHEIAPNSPVCQIYYSTEVNVFSFRNSRKNLLGVDISSSSVKVLEIAQNDENFRLESYGIEATAPNSVIENTIADTEAVGDSIEKAVARSGSNLKECACAIAGSKVITKKITLSSEIPEKDLEGQVQLEMVQHIPHPIEDISIDFQIENNPDDSGSPFEITVVATKSENVDSCVVALERGGLIPKVVDVELFALENALSLTSRISRDDRLTGILGIVDIGSSSTKFSVLEAGLITYNREQNFGGKQLLNEIQRNYGLSYEEAKSSLAKSSLEAGFEEKVVAPFVETASQETERALQLFYSSNNAARIEQVLLTGGCASLNGIADSIMARIEMPVDIINPFEKIPLSAKIDPKKLRRDAPMLLTAFGLSSRGFDF